MELEKGHRMLERRRGELLGPAVEGRPKKNLPNVEGIGDESYASKNRWRRIAEACAPWRTLTIVNNCSQAHALYGPCLPY